jgi:hypothetical protein
MVVQIGFAGSRTLFDSGKHPGVDEAAFEMEVQRLLKERLDRLPAELKLSPHHFLCGISQVAIGADSVFTQACQASGIPQRIFLTQHRDEYLSAVGSGGGRDFTLEREQAARQLLLSPHIIQERVVAISPDRQVRFREVNYEIAREADVVICLLRADADAKPGGTADLQAQAQRRGRPTLRISVSVGSNGEPMLAEEWLGGEFAPPNLPHELAELQIDLSEKVPHHSPVTSALGACAILLPVVAVAALSLAASRDLEARVNIYGELVTFLKKQVEMIENADSEHEFAALVIEAESRLLGETAAWYSRRSFTGVS